MWLLSKTVEPLRLRKLLLKEVEKSRFTVRADLEHLSKTQPGVKVTEVRLRNAKHFCGQHPGPCPVLFGGPRPHRKHKFLEGLDWVGFNQMFNDLMDRKKIDCDFFSYNREMRGGDIANLRHWELVEPLYKGTDTTDATRGCYRITLKGRKFVRNETVVVRSLFFRLGAVVGPHPTDYDMFRYIIKRYEQPPKDLLLPLCPRGPSMPDPYAEEGWEFHNL